MPFKSGPNELLDNRKSQSDTPYTTPPAQKVITQKVNGNIPLNVNLVVKDSEQYCHKHQPASESEMKSLKGQVMCLQSQLARVDERIGSCEVYG